MTESPLLQVLDRLFEQVLLFFCLLLPLFFLPWTSDFFDFNKLFLFYIVVLILLGLWVLKMLVSRTVYVRTGPLDLPLFLVLLTAGLATVFSQDRYYSILGVAGAYGESLITVVFLYVFYYVVVSNIREIGGRGAIGGFVIGSAASAVLYLVNILGINPFDRPWGEALGFNTLGSVAGAMGVYAVAGVAGLVGLVGMMRERREKKGILRMVSWFGKTVSYMVLVVILLAPLALNLLRVGPPVARAGLRTSWTVAATTLGRFPLFGSGLATWGQDYNAFKPLEVNNRADWNTRYATAGSAAINILGTWGILGLAAWVTVLICLIRPISPIGLIILATWILLPVTPVMLILFFLLLAAGGKEGSSWEKKGKEGVYLVAGVAALFIGLCAYFGYKIYAAEKLFQKSQNDIVLTGGKNTYKLQQQALLLNPYSDGLHRAYLQTNIALAAAITKVGEDGQGGKEGVDVETVKALLDQAVRESQIITEALGQNNPANWEARGQLYKNITQTDSNTLPLAISSYNVAVSLDPYSPRLRVELGGLYLQNAGTHGQDPVVSAPLRDKDYQSAASLFNTAIQLKLDYENAHYNLAQVYKLGKNYQAALAELKTVKQIITNNGDLKKINEEIAEVTPLATPSAKAGP